VAPSTSSRASRRSVSAARRRCIRRPVPKLLPRARSSTRSGLARAVRECVRLGLNFNATRARENTFSLSKQFPFSTSEPKEAQRRRHPRHFDERHRLSRCVWSLRFRIPNTIFFSSLSDLHLHFSRKVDRCRSLGGRRDHLFLLSLHFTSTNLHSASVQAVHFLTPFSLLSCEERNCGRPWPAFTCVFLLLEDIPVLA
jgi:hypothetical protein